MKHQRMQSGFTLIELMIVVAIIGIVSGLAYPAFKEQLAKSRRADAKATLVGAQQWMERFYTENFRYDQNSAGVEVTDASQFPSRLRVSPEPQMGSPLYDIRVVLKVENGVKKRDEYSVKATRRAGSAMANDRCGDFSIDHLGRKNVSDYSGFSDLQEARRVCWQ
ncbi:type IV pilin protein [Verminephrobacter eiseniae]|uniref:Fimbrial protein pilin n=1 Tax=Verminephrobacter eiseniae (strain EF01-2) TaxID=391735 RepID=A1WPH6_VEREI|nr:type IV pilin protein [Verminephrobacter eiseniae]ABM59533.1 fimbrial protein pilin [Verminephrobacter eiseniae EF01-2]MCW5259319.1 prepilin-type N-terminal cleavage/methylation domain-containing protein [Verminephrobacter eiseniae]MCW5285059.1 prepilin-type N-terminal cleavage/methylation domain-containing protein [Verminephrobacter eiseniae]MCW5302766.1 prepilin-type N-terminal cleavage/methylation domain-containing protein [Verminephrobacter eiseniae]MCW8181043.1 prepilin-type N-terminal